MDIKDTTVTLHNQLFPGPTPAAGAVVQKLQLLDYDTGKELFVQDFPGVTLGAGAAGSGRRGPQRAA